MKKLSSRPSDAGDKALALQPYEEEAPGKDPSGFEAPVSKRQKLWHYASQAALVLALLGFGWAFAAQFLEGTSYQEKQRAEASAKAEHAKIAALSDEIASLRTSLESLRGAAAKSPNGDEIHALKKSAEGLKSGLDSVKAETNTAIAQMATKLDHAQHEPAAKLQQMAERLDRLEKQSAANSAVTNVPKSNPATLLPAAAPLPKVNPLSHPLSNGDLERRPPLIPNWVVRDVYDGIALVEGEYGAIQVAPGEEIPGAGRVRSIERRGNGWIVITSRGLVASARDY